jgi:hypothetical protein
VSVLIEESRGPKHNRLVLSKALHPSSFHCCLSQDPLYVSVLSSVLGARVRELLRGSVCPRKLFERESSRTRGDNNTVSLSLFSAPSCVESWR